MPKELEEQLNQIGQKILSVTRNELYIHMRFLDVALSSFTFIMNPAAPPFATDGKMIYFHPAILGEIYRRNQTAVNRGYLHMVIHCLLHHLTRRQGREKNLWDLSCDIAAESIMDEWHLRCIRMPSSWLRKETYRKLRGSMKVLTAEGIYRQLKNWNLTDRKLQELAVEFYRDSHSFWPEDKDRKMQNEIENKWKNISEKAETDMQTFSQESSSEAGSLAKQVQVENRERYDYREFLKKFAVMKEEVHVDPDSFDYVFYSYGLSMYGNMPLIEPQEWKEVKKVEEFVIVIDTSMSCSGDLVKKFLEETYGILSGQESFFHKVNIHIIQCDEVVQNDQKITDEKELKEYMEHLELKGEGGTDFRPAFDYVGKLIQEGSFYRLKGLIYFTDGKGIYPVKMPPYETAFVFMQEEYEDVDVPAWAMKLTIDETDLQKGEHDEH